MQKAIGVLVNAHHVTLCILHQPVAIRRTDLLNKKRQTVVGVHGNAHHTALDILQEAFAISLTDLLKKRNAESPRDIWQCPTHCP